MDPSKKDMHIFNMMYLIITSWQAIVKLKLNLLSHKYN